MKSFPEAPCASAAEKAACPVTQDFGVSPRSGEREALAESPGNMRLQRIVIRAAVERVIRELSGIEVRPQRICVVPCVR